MEIVFDSFGKGRGECVESSNGSFFFMFSACCLFSFSIFKLYLPFLFLNRSFRFYLKLGPNECKAVGPEFCDLNWKNIEKIGAQ